MDLNTTVYIYINFRPDPLQVSVNETTTVEEVIIDLCKRLNIGPVARYLFALKSIPTKAWLNLSYKMTADNVTQFEFGIRFNIPEVNRLRSIDLNAYDFYFRQAKYDILNDRIPDINYEKYKSEINGLSVIDMYRATIEDNIPREEVIRDYKNYVPQQSKRKHRMFLKKPIIQKFNEIRVRDVDALYVKSGYLEQFKKIAPNYLREEFNGLVDEDGGVYTVSLRVSPFDTVSPGICIKSEHKEQWEHVCSIEDLCYINIRHGSTIEISRKNGIPLYITFQFMSTVKAFISLLDGYYRLMIKWTFNLCRDLQTPSLKKLLQLRCHGPVSGVFTYRKLFEKRNNKVGCFILRESDLAYDTYYIDVCSKSSSKPVSYKIEMTEDKKYKLVGKEEIYTTLPQLINEYRNQKNDIALIECLPPSEYDQSSLLLCKVDSSACSSNQSDDEEKLSKPVCIDSRRLMVFKNMPRDGSSPYTTVYRSVWYDYANNKRNVAIKVLKENFHQMNLTEFLSLTSRWAFVKAGAVVKLYGFTLSNPVSMVMEYLPLGQLDLYLSNPENRHKIEGITLVEASATLANALYYLEEAGFVHGYIRCRKLLVAAHTDTSFVVKLADPGLCNPYKDIDLHWIPPECHDNTSEARSSVAADVWAFATTLWEIFSLGKLPPNNDAVNIKRFYNSPRAHLPIPPGCPRNMYMLMLECWNYDVFQRKKPQAIMRDINQIFYQVYNTIRASSYSTIKPTLKEVEQDNVSSKSKTSDDLSSSLRSESTLNTLLDDGEEQSSTDLSLDNITSDTNIAYQFTCPGYHCITSKNDMIAFVNQQGYTNNEAMNSISSMQSIFELDKEWNLVLNGRIGEGFYGEVYRGKLLHMYEDKEQLVAVKKMKAEAMSVTNQADFDREISIMLKLDHPNIVIIKGIVQDPELCLVLEYIEHGSLQCYLNIHKERLTTQHLVKFALDVAKGMAYLSEKRLVHRDLAARNILVVNQCYVKISDFGLARFIGNSNYYIFQTERDLPIKWHAPESIEYGKFSQQSDVWSYGVTLYEMFTFGADPRLPNVEQKADDIRKALRNNVRLPMPENCPQYIYANVMVPCWEYSANLRPTFDKLCKIIEEIFLSI